MASRGLRKTYFFSHLKACERRNFDFCVFLEMSSVTGGRVGPGPMRKLAGEGPAYASSNQPALPGGDWL